MSSISMNLNLKKTIPKKYILKLNFTLETWAYKDP